MRYIRFKGRPDNPEARESKEIEVYDFLDKTGIEYDRIDNEPLMTMEDCKGAEESLGAPICKNLLLRNQQKTAFYLLIMPGDKKFKTKQLSAQINSARLSFAEPEFMEDLLNITPGSLSVTGLISEKSKNVRFLMDSDLLKNEFAGIHPSVNTSVLRIKTKDLIDKFLPATGHTVTYVTLTEE